MDVQHVEKTRVEHLEQKVGVTLALLATPPEVVYQRSSPESYLRVSLGGCCKFLLEALSHMPDVKCMKEAKSIPCVTEYELFKTGFGNQEVLELCAFGMD